MKRDASDQKRFSLSLLDRDTLLALSAQSGDLAAHLLDLFRVHSL